MSINDSCRFCHVNLRIKGSLTSTKKVFDSNKLLNELSICERLDALGLKLKRDNSRSIRICKSCFRQIGRLENDLPAFRRWEEEEKENRAEAASSSDDKQPPGEEGDREAAAPEPPRAYRKRNLPRANDKIPVRRSITEVVIHYPSHPGGDRIVCPPYVAGIVENISKENWATAANLIVRHEKLFGQLKENILKVLEDECQVLSNPCNGFMLWRSSPDDLRRFSFEDLQSDLFGMSPFLFSIISQITKDSPHITCAAAAIALRGREPRMSAFAYYLNSVLQYGGASKAVFKRLSKLGLTTSHTAAVGKQKALASICGEGFQLLEVENEILKNGDEFIAKVGGVEGGENSSKSTDAERAAGTSSPSHTGIAPDKETQSSDQFVPPEKTTESTPEDTTAAQEASGTTSALLTDKPTNSGPDGAAGFPFSSVPAAEMADQGSTLQAEAEPPALPTPPPTHSQTNDNLDFYIRTHHPFISQASKPTPRLQPIAIRNAVPTSHWSGDSPKQPITNFNFGSSLTVPQTQAHVQQGFAVLGTRIQTQYLQVFKPIAPAVVHIPHQFSTMTSGASIQVVQQPPVSKEEVPPKQQERSSCMNQEISEPVSIKEEPEDLWSGQEGEQLQGPEEADVIKVTFTPDLVKSEDDAEKPQSSQLHQQKTEQMETGADGEDCGGQEADTYSDEEEDAYPETEVKIEDSSGAETDESTDWMETTDQTTGSKSVEKLKHNKPKTDEEIFSCIECGEKFNRIDCLKEHMRVHTGETPFSCLECGKSFSQQSNLTDHMRCHSEDKPYECPMCGKTFNQKSNLNVHIRIHTGEKPYGCSQCSKRFTAKDNLTVHMRVHSGEKPYDCSVCGKSFYRNSHLTDHMRSHSGEKPFSCPLCGKHFSRNGNLTDHMRSHSGEKPFGCNVCGRHFVQRGSLANHMRIHTRETSDQKGE